VAVADAVVGGQRRGDDRRHAQAAVDRPRPLRHAAETHQRHLRRVDHAVDGGHALLAEAGDRDRAGGELGALERAGAGAADQVEQFAVQLLDVLVVDLQQRRRDQSPVRSEMATPMWMDSLGAKTSSR